MSLVDKLDNQTIICAEGYLFELERRGYLKAGAYVPEVVLDNPEAVKELHREFLSCGSDVMEAFTYYAHRDKMKQIGREEDIEFLNRQALRLAKEVAIEGNALMAGNICNTWIYNHENHEVTASLVKAMYEEQVKWAKEEGADYIIAETLGHVGEAKIALDVIKSHGLEAVITFAPVDSKSYDGYSWQTACKILEERGADVVGLNCSRGPATMLSFLIKIRNKVNCHVAALPVPYRTTLDQPSFQTLQEPGKPKAFPLNLDPFLHTRDELSQFAKHTQKLNINYIGLCCGAAPMHIRAIAEAIGRKVPASRYSPNLKEHGLLGRKRIVRAHNIRQMKGWN